MFRANKLAGACVAVIVATAGQVQAGIITFDINQTWSQGDGQLDIPGTVVSTGGGGDFVVDPGFNSHFFDFAFFGNGTFATINFQIGGYYFLDSYSDGQLIGPGNFGDHMSPISDWDTILAFGAPAGVWNATHDGYLGFRSDSGLFGWIEYSFIRSGNVSTLTLLDGAYEDQLGVGILAGSNSLSTVPEPSTLALFGIGTSVAAVGAARRRRVKLTEVTN